MKTRTTIGWHNIDLYGCTLTYRRPCRHCGAIEAFWMGGCWDDGEEIKTFPSMAAAMAVFAEYAARLHEECDGKSE